MASSISRTHTHCKIIIDSMKEDIEGMKGRLGMMKDTLQKTLE